jgi:hypothetical protein
VKKIHATIRCNQRFGASQIISEGKRYDNQFYGQTRIFRALGTLPPFSTFSAPTFFPLEGHPYLGAQAMKIDIMNAINAA